MVGHAQKVARVREDGTPLLLRRDFDSTNDGEASLHLLSLQRGIGDLERTRGAERDRRREDVRGGFPAEQRNPPVRLRPAPLELPAPSAAETGAS